MLKTCKTKCLFNFLMILLIDICNLQLHKTKSQCFLVTFKVCFKQDHLIPNFYLELNWNQPLLGGCWLACRVKSKSWIKQKALRIWFFSLKIPNFDPRFSPYGPSGCIISKKEPKLLTQGMDQRTMKLFDLILHKGPTDTPLGPSGWKLQVRIKVFSV